MKSAQVLDKEDLSVGLYFKRVKRYSLLTRAQEVELGTKIQLWLTASKLASEHKFTKQEIVKELGLDSLEHLKTVIAEGKQAHAAMVCANLRLVVFIAKDYLKKGVPLEDLIQEGNLALHKASKRFNPSFGTRFSTYAVPWIIHFITVAVHKQSTLVYRPPCFNQDIVKIQKATKTLKKELGKDPNDLQVARYLGMKTARLKQIRLITQGTSSLDVSLNAGKNERTILESCVSEDVLPEEYTDANLLKETIEKALAMLDPKEEQIVRLRFGIGYERVYTINEVSKLVGETRERTRQLENKIISKLRWPNTVKLLEDFYFL